MQRKGDFWLLPVACYCCGAITASALCTSANEKSNTHAFNLESASSIEMLIVGRAVECNGSIDKSVVCRGCRQGSLDVACFYSSLACDANIQIFLCLNNFVGALFVALMRAPFCRIRRNNLICIWTQQQKRMNNNGRSRKKEDVNDANMNKCSPSEWHSERDYVQAYESGAALLSSCSGAIYDWRLGRFAVSSVFFLSTRERSMNCNVWVCA